MHFLLPPPQASRRLSGDHRLTSTGDSRDARKMKYNLDVFLKMRGSAEILVPDPDKHNKLLEVRFEFTLILSSKSTMAVF